MKKQLKHPSTIKPQTPQKNQLIFHMRYLIERQKRGQYINARVSPVKGILLHPPLYRPGPCPDPRKYTNIYEVLNEAMISVFDMHIKHCQKGYILQNLFITIL